jgi:hypothetical protein
MATHTSPHAIYLILILVAGTTACRGPMPCTDCDDDDDAADDMQEDPIPDLPCGGADLMTDPRNCGSCGNDCLEYPDTEWQAGSCQMGECAGPYWHECQWEGFNVNCHDVCGAGVCVARGCSGYTALLNWNNGDFGPLCEVAYDPPYATMSGSCDEPIPWEDHGSIRTYAMCCCG